MARYAISVDGLGKRYRLGAGPARYGRLSEVIWDRLTLRATRESRRGSDRRRNDADDWIWALKDVSLEIEHGEIVGIIGRNGAGKTTLLKVLSRITEPTEGWARLDGRVGSLLEVGTGFHPELTGRENIFLNGAILGMQKAEILRKFDEIVSFAEVERFIDTPVKRYSSGMHVRLAFSVAAHLEPEVLIVDEVLSVGDIGFQRKSLGRMEQTASQGRTVLLVSHNMAAVENLCMTGYLLRSGRVVKSGSTHEVVEAFVSSMETDTRTSLRDRPDRGGDQRLRFTGVRMATGKEATGDLIRCGEDLSILIEYESQRPLRNINLSIGIYDPGGQAMIMCNNEMVGSPFEAIPLEGRFTCSIPRFPLAPGRYFLNLYCETSGSVADWIQQAAFFTVEAADFFGTGRLPPESHGGVLVTQTWGVEPL